MRTPNLPATQSCLSGRDDAGFTLIEMLVSLVIFSMSIAVMSTALFQSGKVLEVVEKGNDSLIIHWRMAKGLEEAIANIMVAANTREATAPFAGDRQSLNALTFRHPLGAPGRPAPLLAKLKPLSQGGTTLEVQDENGNEVDVGNVAGGAEFAYADSNAQLHSQWPVQGMEKEILPRALVVRATGGGAIIAWWPYAGPTLVDQLRPSQSMALFQNVVP